MKTITLHTQIQSKELGHDMKKKKKKKPRARNKNKTDVKSAVAETSSPLKNNPDGSSSGVYAIGQIASLLSSQKKFFISYFTEIKNKTDVKSAIAETSSPLKNNPDGSSSGVYAIGQIASLLSSQKKPQRPDKGGVLSMFDSVGSTSGPTCMMRPAFVPLKKQVERKRGRQNETKPPAEKESKKQKQQQQQQQEQQQQQDPKTHIESETWTLEKIAKTSNPIDMKDSKPNLPKPNPEDLKKTIFIGNIPISYSKTNVLKLFRKFGDIESIRFRSVAPSDPDLPKRVIAHTKQFHPDCNSINSYIVFKSDEAAQKALKRNGKLVGNHHIRVDLAGNSRKHDTKRSVFLGNLPFDVGDDVVREHFEQCGTVENVRIIRDAKTGLGKGFGYLLFAEDVSVEFALKLDGSRMARRDIRVQRATKQKQRALNAVKRLNMKDGAKSNAKGGKPGRVKPGGVKPGHVKPGQVKPRQGNPAQSKSHQLRSQRGGRGHPKKGKAAAGFIKKNKTFDKGTRK